MPPSSIPCPSGSESTRATPPDRAGRLPRRARARGVGVVEPIPLHAERPYGAGRRPRRLRGARRSGRSSSTASTSAPSSAPTAGPTRSRSAWSSRAGRSPGRSGRSCRKGCSGGPGWPAWSSWRLFTVGLWSRVDGGARLGDRRLDGPAGPGEPLRLRPDRLDLAPLPGRHRRERAGRLARPVPRPASSGTGPRWRGRTKSGLWTAPSRRPRADRLGQHRGSG